MFACLARKRKDRAGFANVAETSVLDARLVSMSPFLNAEEQFTIIVRISDSYVQI